MTRRNLSPLTVDDLQVVETALRSSTLPAAEVLARLEAGTMKDVTCFEISGPNATTLQPNDCFTLRRWTFEEFNVVQQRISEIKVLEDSTAAVRARFTAVLDDTYQGVGAAEMAETSWDDAQSTSDKLRIGTGTGYGTSALNYSVSDFEPLALVALKFYRWPVDKSLPDPYWGRGRMARMSLAVGALVSTDLSYRGNGLEKPTAGVYPLVGLSYDVTRDFGVQLGLIFFEEPSTNPVSTDKFLRSAPYTAIVFDFDAANRIAGLFKKE
jgi:hypothetical protein